MNDMRDRLQRIARGAEDPHVDVLELVNWVYFDQRAHLVSGRDLIGGERAAAGMMLGSDSQASMIAKLSEIGRLGCRVSGAGYNLGELHPVAETIHLEVLAIQAEQRAPARLLEEFGKRRALPPGYDLQIRLGPRWKAEPRYDLRVCEDCGQSHSMPKVGAFKVVLDTTSTRAPFYCPLDWDHGPDYQAELRREYSHWYLALRVLAERLSGAKLNGVVVTGPRIEAEPWRAGDQAAAPIPLDEPSRLPESSQEKRPFETFVLSILEAAAKHPLIRSETGQWGGDDGPAINDGLAQRLVDRGILVARSSEGEGARQLLVTAAGLAALKAARLVS